MKTWWGNGPTNSWHVSGNNNWKQRTSCEKQQVGERQTVCKHNMGIKGFLMKKLQEEWAKRLNGKQWKLLVKGWFGVLPRRWGWSYDTDFEKLWINRWRFVSHFLLKRSTPEEKLIEIQSSDLSSGKTHTQGDSPGSLAALPVAVPH